MNILENILTYNNIKFKDENPHSTCKNCLVGKQHRNSYPASQSRASRTCELIHSDLCRPMKITSLGGARYFLLLKDEFKLQICALKYKSEVKHKITIFIKMTETETGK